MGVQEPEASGQSAGVRRAPLQDSLQYSSYASTSTGTVSVSRPAVVPRRGLRFGMFMYRVCGRGRDRDTLRLLPYLALRYELRVTNGSVLTVVKTD